MNTLLHLTVLCCTHIIPLRCQGSPLSGSHSSPLNNSSVVCDSTVVFSSALECCLPYCSAFHSTLHCTVSYHYRVLKCTSQCQCSQCILPWTNQKHRIEENIYMSQTMSNLKTNLVHYTFTERKGIWNSPSVFFQVYSREFLIVNQRMLNLKHIKTKESRSRNQAKLLCVKNALNFSKMKNPHV